MKTFINIAILILILTNMNVRSLNVCVPSENFTCPYFKAMVDLIDSILLGPNKEEMPKTVRMIFHDCVSGCNGCIDLDNADNAGLSGQINSANRVFRAQRNVLFFDKFTVSLADIFALNAMRSIYITSKGLTIPACDFKFGRKTCTGPQDNKEIFTTSLGNWNTIKTFFADNFNFSTQEIVALMGAHALGRTWSTNSGHVGPWVANDNIVFNNQFYINLLDKDGKLDYKPHTTATTLKKQWHSAKESCDGYTKCKPLPLPSQRIMLNSDMCMLKLFDLVDAEGTPSCTYSTCPTNEDGKVWIEKYAASEPDFKADFGAVFQKLVEWKCEGLVDPENSAGVKFNYENYQNEKLITMIMKTSEKLSTKEQFKIYHFLFKKKYSLNSEEGINRYLIFKANLKLINEKNSKLNLGKYGINKYTDRTNGEYYKAVTGTESNFIDFDKFADLEMDPYEHIQLNA